MELQINPKLKTSTPWIVDGIPQKVLILREDHSDVPVIRGYKQVLLYGPYYDALQIVEFTDGPTTFITFDVAMLYGLKDYLRPDLLYFCRQRKLRRADFCCDDNGGNNLMKRYFKHAFDI